MATQAEIKLKLNAITADVAEETTQIAGIEHVLDNLAALVNKLLNDANNAEVDPAITVQIEALGSAVGANKQRIIDDINKNTPVSNANKPQVDPARIIDDTNKNTPVNEPERQGEPSRRVSEDYGFVNDKDTTPTR